VRLPDPERVFIDTAKLRAYLLSDSHPVGRFKAAFFRSLGYTHERPDELEAALRRLARTAEAELDDATVHGQKYRVTGMVVGPAGAAASVTAIWIVLHGERGARFVTAFPGERK
jgi:hypothetical protein